MNAPRNLTRKLLDDHLLEGDLVPGEEMDLTVDQILIEDATGSMTALQFEALGADSVAVPLAVMYVDHNVLQIDDKNMDDRQILNPPPPEEARNVEIVCGPNIVPPPEGRPLPEELEGRIVIVIEDDVSTGDMAPDGALGMSLWSNIPECAKYMFRRQDPEFHDRALEWGGGFIVGGHNYGQGSSREHAALAALHLGIRAVIARSFARIHRRNLISQSILPLLFREEDDYERVSRGDTWKIEGVREPIAVGEQTLVVNTDDGTKIELEIRLSPREREVLLAGGTLKFLRGA
jgi:3-isopropylmalate dehydratase small subunit